VIHVSEGHPVPFAISPQDTASPLDAVRRASESGLFAAFAWDGYQAKGSFVQFAYGSEPGVFTQVSAILAPDTTTLVDSITIAPFTPEGMPTAFGATFLVNGSGLLVTAHDDPTALLEFRTSGTPHVVTLRFPPSVTSISPVTRSSRWPASALAFNVGATSGRLLLGGGTMNVSDDTVTANLTSTDLLVFRTVPSFAPDRLGRDALLAAFGAGRIIADFSLVAGSNGTWAENSARFRVDLSALPSAVQTSRASVLIASMRGIAGLIVIGFDPATMPGDGTHEIVVRANGNVVPQFDGDLATMIATSSAAGRASFSRMAMNATVVAVYVPGIVTMTLSISSEPAPALIDLGTALAIFAALLVVMYAGMRMFRRPVA
jgi:hypothetical protein